MSTYLTILILSIFIAIVAPDPAIHDDTLARNEFIAAINARATTWTAGINPGPEPPYMTSSGEANPAQLRLLDADPLLEYRNGTDALPETFDARDYWPECPSLREVRNQGCCASCYAVSVAAAMTDRWCIHSNGTQQHRFSAQDLAGCCVGCGDCSGGRAHMVWWHWRQHGVVSGGEFDSQEGCRPYEVDACVFGQPDPERLECANVCRVGYAVAYEADRRFGARTYQVMPDEQMIMLNIFRNGPLSATFQVFSDFYSYRTGVYQHTFGRFRGWHTVKLLGWGIEDGTNYWLAANAWGSSWGEIGGFFKILRGVNHLGIKGQVFGGMPRYD